MPVEVILPKVDMDMATGKISKWLARDGDLVVKGAPLFEIETDKAAMEIDAPASGYIRNILVNEGGSSPVGAPVAWIYADGEAVGPRPLAPVAMTPAAPVASVHTVPVAHPDNAATDGRRATPLARRLARELNVSLATVAGTGPHGRIVADDVRLSAQRAIVTPEFAATPSSGVAASYASGSFEARPVDAMRRTIAQRLTVSKNTVPHFYLSATCTLDKLLEIRAALNAAAPRDADASPAWKLSVNDFIIKAMALALQRVPAANVTWADTDILHHKASDIGVAVAVDGGLFTPVVRDAQAKTLSAISLDMKDLAARARARKLVPAEYQGGTTAISNLGMYGIEQFTAIINPPHATILAVGAGVERFVPIKGQPVLRTQITCTLSCDHRAVDGAVGAELLQAVRSFIEEPLLMLA